MRRFTLITIIVLLAALAIAAWYQLRLAGRDERLPGPRQTATP